MFLLLFLAANKYWLIYYTEYTAASLSTLHFGTNLYPKVEPKYGDIFCVIQFIQYNPYSVELYNSVALSISFYERGIV